MEDNAGNLIRSLRQKLGMTQEEFAHEIAVTVSRSRVSSPGKQSRTWPASAA